jgi:hypothetical protein
MIKWPSSPDDPRDRRAWLALIVLVGAVLLALALAGCGARALNAPPAGAPDAPATPERVEQLLTPPMAHPVPAAQTTPPILVQVTATPAVPTMAPVIVTPTPELSAAEQDARTRAAVEAMRQSTEHLPAQMPGAP